MTEGCCDMRVLLLAWEAGSSRPALASQPAGLACALADDGHRVRLVTRLPEGARPPRLPGVEVHAVTDAPPIVPPSMADAMLGALGFAGRATSVAVRRLEEEPVDLVHAEGWATAPVVAALQHCHDVPVLGVVEPWEAGADDPTVAELAASLVARADVRAARAAGAAGALPPGTSLPVRRPGPPPAKGPLHLVAGPAARHRAVARVLRAALPAPRRISRSWSRRPAAVVVLDPTDLDAAVRGLGVGVPVVTVAGPTGALVAAAGAGVVLAAGSAPEEVAAAVRALLADRERWVTLGAAAATAATHHGWPAVAGRWRELAGTAVARRGGPHLHTTG